MHSSQGDDGDVSASEEDALLPASVLRSPASFSGFVETPLQPSWSSQHILAVFCGLVAAVALSSLVMTAGGNAGNTQASLQNAGGSLPGQIQEDVPGILAEHLTQDWPTILPLNCWLKVQANRGDTILVADYAGLTAGDTILIGNSDLRRITGVNPFRIDFPLSREYPVGTPCEYYDRAFPRASLPQTTGAAGIEARTPNWAIWYHATSTAIPRVTPK